MKKKNANKFFMCVLVFAKGASVGCGVCSARCGLVRQCAKMKC